MTRIEPRSWTCQPAALTTLGAERRVCYLCNSVDSQPQWVAHTLAVENCQQQARMKSQRTVFAGARPTAPLLTAQPSSNLWLIRTCM
jgi:hypothetical protein